MNTPCLNWTQHIRKNGYGQSKYKGKTWLAHRLTWYLANGTIPEGMVIMHRCDNKKCVNLEHLMLGTIRINNYDKVLKGRSTKGYSGLKGEDSPGCKLNNLDVLEIRQLMNYPLSQREIGKYYGVADTTISAIKLQKYWKHIL